MFDQEKANKQKQQTKTTNKNNKQKQQIKTIKSH
jgi:hypothetical protein